MGFYPSAEIQLVSSTVPTNWVGGEVLSIDKLLDILRMAEFIQLIENIIHHDSTN